MATQSDTWLAAARLVRRTGFGATGAEVDAAVRMGVAGYVEAILAADPAADPGALATPSPTLAAVAAPPAGASKQQRAQANQQRAEQAATLTEWWLQRMVAVHVPFGEKLTFCWHNHFATSAEKVRAAQWMLQQNDRLRMLGRRDFRTLAQAMLVDAAMLDWLDGEKNTVKGANENLSREFMELFALGHGGGYTETDVREGARALTGWRIQSDGSTSLRPRLHDQGSKTVLGVTGNLDQEGFGDAVLARPASAQHVAARTYGQLVSDTPPTADVLDRLVAAYGRGRDLSALLRTMLTDPSFAAAANSIVAGPVEWLIGAVRALRVPVTDDKAARRLAAVLRELGQLPFFPPNVGGWPYGQAWLSTAAADLRMRTALALTSAADLSSVRSASATDRLDAVGYLLGVGEWSARSRAALQPHLGDPAQLTAIALNAPEYLVH